MRIPEYTRADYRRMREREAAWLLDPLRQKILAENRARAEEQRRAREQALHGEEF